MAINEFPLPDLGEGLTEGEILKWLVAEGDTIELNQPIVEVETAKAAVEIPAKWAGKVVKIHHPEGAVVNVGDSIIAIEVGGSGAAPSQEGGLIGETKADGRTAVLVGYGPKSGEAKRRPRAGGSVPSAPANGVATGSRPASPTQAVGAAFDAGATAAPAPPVTQAPAPPVTETPAPRGTGPVLAKPPVRKMARDLGVDLTAVVGTGPQGSITREDVNGALGGAVSAPRQPAVRTGERETRIPIKGVRKLTAANMVQSAFTAPHVTEFLTIDATRTVNLVERLKAQPAWRDVRISPLLMAAKAILLGIQRYPMINSTWSDQTEEIIVKNYVNLGVAAATDRGLIVPNIKDADSLALRDLADALNNLVATAKSGKTPPSDMTGGTFTITNVGVFGIDSGTPILPPGEAAILAFGAIREMPWVHNGEVCVRMVTTLALSFDHRIIDGELGSKFLRDVGDFLTDPEAALLAWS